MDSDLYQVLATENETGTFGTHLEKKGQPEGGKSESSPENAKEWPEKPAASEEGIPTSGVPLADLAGHYDRNEAGGVRRKKAGWEGRGEGLAASALADRRCAALAKKNTAGGGGFATASCSVRGRSPEDGNLSEVGRKNGGSDGAVGFLFGAEPFFSPDSYLLHLNAEGVDYKRRRPAYHPMIVSEHTPISGNRFHPTTEVYCGLELYRVLVFGIRMVKMLLLFFWGWTGMDTLFQRQGRNGLFQYPEDQPWHILYHVVQWSSLLPIVCKRYGLAVMDFWTKSWIFQRLHGHKRYIKTWFSMGFFGLLQTSWEWFLMLSLLRWGGGQIGIQFRRKRNGWLPRLSWGQYGLLRVLIRIWQLYVFCHYQMHLFKSRNQQKKVQVTGLLCELHKFTLRGHFGPL
ncbi:hypothetical protein LXL04_004325 [Taraxacum kok-saghyz]